MSVETTTSRFDGLKWLIVFALVGAAVVGNSYYADQSLLYRVLGIVALGIVAALDTFKLMTALLVLIAGVVGFYYFEDESQLLRVLGMLGVAAVAFAIVATSHQGRQGLAFVKDAHLDPRILVWPTRQETLQTTIAVLIMVIIVAIMLWLFDMFLGWGVSKLLT